MTWRLKLNDLAGLTTAHPETVIWVLWHNRLLVVPILYRRFFSHRKGAALISRSKDGKVLADCIERFGGLAVRGSSSRGGATALAELKRLLADGTDAYITPDGPRGPRYNMGNGAVWLAQSSGTSIVPLHMECSSCWRLGRWDGFIIPKPFARVTVTLQPFYKVQETSTPEEFEAELVRLRAKMMEGTELK